MPDDSYEFRYSWSCAVPASIVPVIVPMFYRHHPIHGFIWTGRLWSNVGAARAFGLPFFKPSFVL